SCDCYHSPRHGTAIITLFSYTTLFRSQAGNLVRTIPPEGVEFVSSALWPQIDTDRVHDVRKIFTRHRMETRYKYNSLNQLIEQTDRKSTRLNSSHEWTSYAVFCLKKRK